MPAESAYLSVLRTATAGLAARLDFTLDEIEDLRIAVDEACAMLLPDVVDPASRSPAGSCSSGTAWRSPSWRAAAADGHRPSDSFAWTVLTALAGEVEAHRDDGRVTVTPAQAAGLAE